MDCKCTLYKVQGGREPTDESSRRGSIELPTELPIVLPIDSAKGPGPDRLGLGGQGSWAGPAWLGGPRVLGRAGLVLHYFNIMVLLYIILSLF